MLPAKRQGNQLITNFTVLSEVINRAIRMEWKKLYPKSKPSEYKPFRNSQEGKEALADIYTVVGETILSEFEVEDRTIDKQDILTLSKH